MTRLLWHALVFAGMALCCQAWCGTVSATTEYERAQDLVGVGSNHMGGHRSPGNDGSGVDDGWSTKTPWQPRNGANSDHPTTTEAALAVLCPGSEHLAEHIDEAAHRYLVPRLTIVAQIWCESRCRPGAIGLAGEVGLLQIHGVAANGLGLFELVHPRANIMTAARWLSMRERDCGGQVAGLAGYNARHCSGGRKYARRVLAVVQRIRMEIARKDHRS